MRECPHANIVHCPLYHASHEALGGCDDGRLDEGACAVARGLDYHAAVGQLSAVAPRLVAELRWKEDVAAARQQRERNLRLAGLH